MATTATGATRHTGHTEFPPPSGGVRFPCFDGLRAMAAVAVMFAHSSLASGLNVRSSFGDYLARLDMGVAIFFLISGFLLYRPFVARAYAERRAPETGPYFRRRFLRIYPAYWVGLTAVLLYFPHPHVNNTFDLFLHYSLLHIYSVHTVLGPVQQAWSLATELSFYVFLPLYAWALARIVRASRHRFCAELTGVAVLYAISVVSRLVVFTVVRDPDYRGVFGTWLIARLDQFALGMLLAVLSVWVVRYRVALVEWLARPWVPGLSWVVAGVSYWAVSTRLGLIPGPSNDETVLQLMGLQFLYGATAFFLILPAVFGPANRGLVRGFLRFRVVAWLGVISYGIYLWHEAWLDLYLEQFKVRFFQGPFLTITIFMSALTVLTAAVSWHVLEQPLLRLKNRALFTHVRHPHDRAPEPGSRSST